MHSSTSTKTLCLFALLVLPGCYESHLLRLGEPVEVYVASRDTSVPLEPAVGAHVVAERCSDGERREAVVDGDGIAWLPFIDVDCWTVTVVREVEGGAFIQAVSVMEARVDTMAPVLLVDLRVLPSPPGTDHRDYNWRATITGRSAPDSAVRLEAPGYRGPDSEPGTWSAFTTTEDQVSGVHDVSSHTDVPNVAIEYDDSQLINATLFSFGDPTSGLSEATVVLPDPPIAFRQTSLSVELPATGARDLSNLRIPRAWAMRIDHPNEYRTLGWLADAPPPAVDSSSARHRLNLEWADLEWPGDAVTHYLELGLVGDTSSCETGRFTAKRAGMDDVTLMVPPIESMSADFRSPVDFDIQLGGPGMRGYVQLVSEGSSWWIEDGTPGVLELHELPPWPSAVLPISATSLATGSWGAVSYGVISPEPSDHGPSGYSWTAPRHTDLRWRYDESLDFGLLPPPLIPGLCPSG